MQSEFTESLHDLKQEFEQIRIFKLNKHIIKMA